MPSPRALLLVLALALPVASCVSPHVSTTPTLAEQHATDSTSAGSGPAAEEPPPADSVVPRVPPLDAYIAHVREMSWKARPTMVKTGLATVESSNPRLALALAALAVFPSAQRHIEASDAYRRVGVMDKAHEQLSLAVKLDSRNARAYDGLARIWRDWGFPNMGLPDAYRAVFYAPNSPEAHNTLGTILQALGEMPAARAEYEHALALNPRAAYAMNNLGTLDLVAGEPLSAARRCEEALRLDSTLRVAARNLQQAQAVIRAAAVEVPDGRH